MATDQGTARGTVQHTASTVESTEVSPAGPATRPAPRAAAPMSRRALLVSIAVAVSLVAWFFFAWLALDRHVIDAAGESIGSAFALLLVVSVVGAIRGRGRH